MNIFIICIILSVPLLLFGATNYPCDTCTVLDSLITIDNNYVSRSFIKKFYLHSQLDQFLNNYQEDVIYQIETTGDFSQIDPFVFSFAGNSYQWNKYYYNNARINDTYSPGSSLFKPSMDNIDLEIDHLNSALYFTNNPLNNHVLLQSNLGALGGPAPYSEDLIHLFHRTSTEALYKPVPDQRRITGDSKFVWQTNLNYKSKMYAQTFSVLKGQRIMPDYKYDGISNFYPEDYFQFQANGELPNLCRLFDKNYYLLSFVNRGNLFVEQGFNRNESAKYSNINISFIGDKTKNDFTFTNGLNLSFKKIKHNELKFYRNIADQDGEGFEPWYPDADVLEFSHSFNLKRKLFTNTFFTINSFNACVLNAPTTNEFYNPLYFESFNMSYTSMYVNKWEAAKFATGVLENTAGVHTKKTYFNEILTFKANADLTFDGVLMSEKTLINPNAQYGGAIILKPVKFIEVSFTTGKIRVPFNYDLVRFLSNNYLNGDVYFWNDLNNDKVFSNNETGKLLTTTGGKYHEIPNSLKQPAYYFLEAPLKINFTKKQFITLTYYYRKYINTWYVDYSTPLEQNGFFENNSLGDYFFMYPQQRTYNVVQYNTGHMLLGDKNDRTKNAPYSQGITLKYQLETKKIFFSASWTTYVVLGYSGLGNGYSTNNVGILSESLASPNTKYQNTGYLDSDRSYIGRLLLSYRVSKKLTSAFQFLYKDGTPFAFFNTEVYSDFNGKQVAIKNDQPKGGNRLTPFGGPRKDGVFNTELRFQYSTNVCKNKLNVNLTIYNMYDFRTELSEYTFSPVIDKRYTLELNIPRGALITLQYFL